MAGVAFSASDCEQAAAWISLHKMTMHFPFILLACLLSSFPSTGVMRIIARNLFSSPYKRLPSASALCRKQEKRSWGVILFVLARSENCNTHFVVKTQGRDVTGYSSNFNSMYQFNSTVINHSRQHSIKIVASFRRFSWTL